MTTLVFRAPANTSDPLVTALAFEAPEGTGGSLYTPSIPTLVQDPVLTYAKVVVVIASYKTISFAQQPDLTVLSDPHITFTLTQTPVMEVYAATNLASVGEFTQDPALAYIKGDARTFSFAQAPSLTVDAVTQGGSSFSTFFKTYAFTQAPPLSIQHGSQTHFSFVQAPVVSATVTADIGGILVTPMFFDLVQRPVLDARVGVNFRMGAHYTGGWLEVVPRKPPPTKADLRLAAKEKEREERKRLAIIAAEKIKEDEAKRAAEIARINALVQQMDAMDAAFRPQYEHQIQQLQQAVMAQEMEIARLRQQLAQGAQTLQ